MNDKVCYDLVAADPDPGNFAASGSPAPSGMGVGNPFQPAFHHRPGKQSFNPSGGPVTQLPSGPVTIHPPSHQTSAVIGPNGYGHFNCPQCGDTNIVNLAGISGPNRVFSCGYGGPNPCGKAHVQYIPTPPPGAYGMSVSYLPSPMTEIKIDPIPNICKCDLWGGCKCGVFKREMEEKRKRERDY